MTVDSLVSIDISDLLGDVSLISNVDEKLNFLKKYLVQLEAELRNIRDVKHQLPICMSTIEKVIEEIYKKIKACTDMKKNIIVIKEFLPLKSGNLEDEKTAEEVTEMEKKEWMKSAQLWTNNDTVENYGVHSQDFVSHLNLGLNGAEISKYKNRYEQISKRLNNGEGLYVPFQGNLSITENLVNTLPLSCDTTRPHLSATSYLRSSVPPFLVDPSRKPRRNWSPELHQKFEMACKKLGGALVASPKQIKEMMNVEGLTLDEIKSHLQKYRTHIKKNPPAPAPAPASASSAAASGVWMISTSSSSASGVYSPNGPVVDMQRPPFSGWFRYPMPY